MADLHLEVDPMIFQAILSSIHMNPNLKALNLGVYENDETGQVPLSSIARLLLMTPNLESLTAVLTLSPQPPRSHGLEIPLNLLRDLSITTLGMSVNHSHLVKSLRVPASTRAEVHFPIICPETLHCLSGLCKDRSVGYLRLITAREFQLDDQWIQFLLDNNELSVTLPSVVPGGRISPLLASLTDLNCIGSLAGKTPGYRGQFLDLINTTRVSFPLRTFNNLTSLELHSWKPAAELDTAFHLDVIGLIFILRVREEQSVPISKLLLSQCSFPHSARRAFEVLVSEVNVPQTTFYFDYIFIIPN
ncbi:hypothetical protein PM082_000594 [Marasmius tenuissimus]|nr:hypothetical protein PM082_000594 [Marasmius tenuissimus]